MDKTVYGTTQSEQAAADRPVENSELRELLLTHPQPCDCGFCYNARKVLSRVEELFASLQKEIDEDCETISNLSAEISLLRADRLTREEVKHINDIAYNLDNVDECSVCAAIAEKFWRISEEGNPK